VSSLACAKKKKFSLLVTSNDDLTMIHSNLSLSKVAFQNEILLGHFQITFPGFVSFSQ